MYHLKTNLPSTHFLYVVRIMSNLSNDQCLKLYQQKPDHYDVKGLVEIIKHLYRIIKYHTVHFSFLVKMSVFFDDGTGTIWMRICWKEFYTVHNCRRFLFIDYVINKWDKSIVSIFNKWSIIN